MSPRPPKPPDREASPRFKRRRARRNGGRGKPTIVQLPTGELNTDVPLSQQRLIGRVVVAFAKLEGAIQTIIWELLGLEIEDGRILTARNDFDTNLLILRSLAARHLPPPQKATFLDLLDLAKDRQEDRNFIVHGTWGTLNEYGLPAAASIRKKIEPEHVFVETFPPSRMHSITRDIERAHGEMIAISVAFAASRGKPKAPPSAG